MSRSTMLLERFYPESRFGGYSDIDGTIVFYTRVRALLGPSHTVLDVGCGRGAYADDPVRVRADLRTLRGRVARVIGIDVDPEAAGNPLVDEFRRIEGDRWPIDDGMIDVAVADWVLEHVRQPHEFFAEARRVLRPGGVLCLRTANVLSYVGLAARLVPKRLHARVVRGVGDEREARDVFPTVYRCNTVRRVRHALSEHDFDGIAYGYHAEPHYLQFSSTVYRVGRMHQRHAPGFIRPSIFAFARRLA